MALRGQPAGRARKGKAAGSPKDRVLTLKNRYKINLEQTLGEGATSVVYRGLDVQEYQNVAVKIYKCKYSYEHGSDSQREEQAKSLDDFRKTVSVLASLGVAPELHRASLRRLSSNSFDNTALSHSIAATMRPSLTSMSSDSTNSIIQPVLERIDTTCCYVRLLDHSVNSDLRPGPDEIQELLYVVLELGEESLADRLSGYRESGRSLTVQELRELQWALASIVWGLHAAGYVHMDIKPENIMRFGSKDGSRWKLVDLDGAVETGANVSLLDCTFTPEYMPPELARAWLKKEQHLGEKVKLSRIMDVWSIGMCSLEAIFLQPVLHPWFAEWRSETGGDGKFFAWLGDYGTEPILSGDMHDLIAGIDEDMCDLLQSMLVKDPAGRLDIAQCLLHNWFEPLRTKCLRGMTRGATAERSAFASSEEPQPQQARRSHICGLM